MGTLISVFLAATLQGAGDIRTGHDLLAACTHRDTRACDAFISDAVRARRLQDCVDLSRPNEIRGRLIDFIEQHPDPRASAADYFIFGLGARCAAD